MSIRRRLSGSTFGLSLHFEDNILKGKAGAGTVSGTTWKAADGMPFASLESENIHPAERPFGAPCSFVVFFGQKIVRGRLAKLPVARIDRAKGGSARQEADSDS